MKFLWMLCLLGANLLAAGQGRYQPSFSFFDVNGDGKITKTEFNDSRQKRIEQKKAEGRMMKNLDNAPGFSDIDTNGDGIITQKEFDAHRNDQAWGCFDNRF